MELALAPYDDFLLDTWDRPEIYRFFRPYQDPFFQVTAPLRITGAKKRCAERKDSFFLYYLFHSLKVVQQETAFCLRFDPDHSDRLRRYKFVHAGCTIAQEDGTFRLAFSPFMKTKPHLWRPARNNWLSLPAKDCLRTMPAATWFFTAFCPGSPSPDLKMRTTTLKWITFPAW